MKISKIIGVMTALMFALPAFSAKADSKKIKIVATVFPVYDWAREILGENAKNAELTFLLGNGVDLHSFQPSAKDIVRLGNADVFIYIGGESDEWTEEALESTKNPKRRALNLLESLGDKAKFEEIVEGMEHNHDDDDDEDEHHHDEDDAEKDEHIWLSVKNAKILCAAICEAICEADSANAPLYKKNLANYTKKLSDLDARFEKTAKSSSKKTLIFADRFPFRYFTDDYGLNYYAAFAGCSAETEANLKTIIFLSNKLDELKLGAVCKIDGSNGKMAKSVVRNSKSRNAKIVEFDSMQSTTAKAAKKGATYISVMEKNLSALENALK